MIKIGALHQIILVPHLVIYMRVPIHLKSKLKVRLAFGVNPLPILLKYFHPGLEPGGLIYSMPPAASQPCI